MPDESIAADASLEELIPRLASGVQGVQPCRARAGPPALLTASAVLAVLEREQTRRTRP